MLSAVVSLTAAAAHLSLLLVAIASPVSTAVPTAVVDGPSAVVHGPSAEVARIRAHFDSVLVELRVASTAHLAPAQRQRREELLTTLRTYRDAGLFPRNYDFPAAPTPYFVDRRTGVLCAVAHLLAHSGRRDLVDRVAAANNNVWVPALAPDTAFTDWLRVNGLTIAEAARIQVPYMVIDERAPGSVRNDAYTGSVALMLGSGLATSV